MRKGRKYKFNIINMMKPDSVYNQGLRPLVYSNKEAETKGCGWDIEACGEGVGRGAGVAAERPSLIDLSVDIRCYLLVPFSRCPVASE